MKVVTSRKPIITVDSIEQSPDCFLLLVYDSELIKETNPLVIDGIVTYNSSTQLWEYKTSCTHIGFMYNSLEELINRLEDDNKYVEALE